MPADNHCRFCSPETICISPQPEMVVGSIGTVVHPWSSHSWPLLKDWLENICRKSRNAEWYAELDFRVDTFLMEKGLQAGCSSLHAALRLAEHPGCSCARRESGAAADSALQSSDAVAASPSGAAPSCVY